MKQAVRGGMMLGLLGALACGSEPPPMLPILDEVDLLVQDDFLLESECAQIGGLELRGRMRFEGIAATCGLTIQRDGEVVSICGDVPGKRERTLEVEYLADDGLGELSIMTLSDTVDLTRATRSPVTLDLSRNRTRVLPDTDGDGASNFDELCAGADPRAP